jgi:hypothetical protein
MHRRTSSAEGVRPRLPIAPFCWLKYAANGAARKLCPLTGELDPDMGQRLISLA